jgi:hypothetical protein
VSATRPGTPKLPVRPIRPTWVGDKTGYVATACRKKARAYGSGAYGPIYYSPSRLLATGAHTGAIIDPMRGDTTDSKRPMSTSAS